LAFSTNQLNPLFDPLFGKVEQNFSFSCPGVVILLSLLCFALLCFAFTPKLMEGCATRLHKKKVFNFFSILGKGRAKTVKVLIY
jgi:hypothetical protein